MAGGSRRRDEHLLGVDRRRVRPRQRHRAEHADRAGDLDPAVEAQPVAPLVAVVGERLGRIALPRDLGGVCRHRRLPRGRRGVRAGRRSPAPTALRAARRMARQTCGGYAGRLFPQRPKKEPAADELRSITLAAAIAVGAPTAAGLVAVPAAQAHGYQRDQREMPRVTGFDVRAIERIEPGADLEFTVWGTPGSVATLRIDGAQRATQLVETSPGVYRARTRSRGATRSPRRARDGEPAARQPGRQRRRQP